MLPIDLLILPTPRPPAGDWLNAGPASMLDLGMPAGFVGRLGVGS